MKAGLSQSARLGQELRINPRMYQAMDMLYMPLLDLQQHLKQELLVNPFLELVEDEEEEESAEGEAVEEAPEQVLEPAATTSTDTETDWEEILLNGFEAEGGMAEQRDEGERY